MRRLTVAAAIALVSGFAWVLTASAGGGNSITNAPELPIGSTVTGGGVGTSSSKYVEYWRLALQGSDFLKIDYSATDTHGVTICLLAPSVTDYTLSDATCAVKNRGFGKHEFRWTVPSAGRWTMELENGNTYVGYSPENDSLAYELTAYVQHFTSTRLTVPSVVAAKHRLRIKGSVTGVTGGQIVVSVSKKSWKRRAVVRIASNGSFSWTTKVGGHGIYRANAKFYGDSGHRSSSKAATVRVV